ncbi:unnamed protein product [Microthlaspi erraticum]|uniref:Uncharacterized protein n=1 Tax=Microthlaspi erraticum TaxID=1685480 RepID=A0A6D2KIP4_9BRAS|nr:unnamed protein product [Microthlaspi erraticum]CAA7051523.1 unnamed protein product [Microthlaspi erraticum]
MDEENNHMEEDSCDMEESVCGDPKVDIRVGDEYQAELPPLMSESERAAFLDDSSCSFVMGRPLEVMWINTKDQERLGGGDDDVDMSESLKSLKTKTSRNGKGIVSLEAVPEKQSSSWDEFEVDGFVLGLYTFGKDFAQMNKLLDSKETRDILSFYYGKFYKSAKHKIWSSFLKKRSRRCVQGKKLYSGWRLQQLLTRLIPSVPSESEKKKLVDVSKSFAEGNRSLEDYITAVKELVGLRSLVEAVAIGKEKEDLTVLTTEPVNSKQWFTVSSAVPAAGLGVYTSLTCHEIVEKLSGGSRLSKARCNDIFWEAVWPRLLARGWHSEQTKDNNKIVFLVPGVKKFSRRKLVKKSHYFDCVSDILAKVVADPELLEFETAENRPPVNQEKRRYLKSPEPCSTHMKFTVVDPAGLACGGKLCELREMKFPNPNQEASVERLEMSLLDEEKHAKFGDECKWRKKRMMKLVEDPDAMRFMIVDASLEHGGIKRRRHLPGDENRREAIDDDDDDSPQKKYDETAEYTNGNSSGVKEETLEFVQQGRSKKRSARKPESSNHHPVTSSFPLPKRRRLSVCVRKDIKRSGESSVLKPPALEETGNGIEDEIQERQESEPNGLSSKKQEVSASEEEEQQGNESNRLCLDQKHSSKDLETAQQQEEPIQVPAVSGSEKNSPSPSTTDHGTTNQQVASSKQEEEEEQNQEANNTDLLPRRQSTRKRPLTTRALEALESGFLTAKSTNTTSKPRKRERSKRIKHRNRAQDETENETTASKPLDQIEDSEPRFLANEGTAMQSKAVEQTEDSKKVTTGFPRLPPIVLRLPFKRR